MKTMKRAAALLIALVLCMGLMVTGAAAEYTDEAAIVNNEAVSVLETLGVINGEKNADGTSAFHPERIVTRAEMCKMLCLVLNGGKEPAMSSPDKYSFSDIKGHWAADYIEFVAGLNIVNGLGDGTFAPDSPVTGQQAAKMLLVAMGYDAEYEQMVGSQWASRADALANLNGLYDKLPASFLTTDALSRDNAAQMVYNALFCTMRYYISAGEHGTVGVQSCELSTDGVPYTLFRFYYDAYMLEGIVIVNSDGIVYPVAGPEESGRPGRIFMDVHLEDGTTMSESWRSTDDSWFEDPTYISNYGDSLDFNTTGELLGMSVRYAYFTAVRAGITSQRIIGAPVATEFNKVIKITEPGVYTDKELGIDLNINLEEYSNDYSLMLVNNTFWSLFIDPDSGMSPFSSTVEEILRINENGVYISGNGYVSRIIDNDDDGKAEVINNIVTTPYKVESVKDGFVTLRDLTKEYDYYYSQYGMLLAGDIWNYFFEDCYTGDQNESEVALIPLDRIVSADGDAKTVKEGDILLAAVYGGRVNCFDYSTFTGSVDKIASRDFEEDGEEWNEKFVTVDGKAYGFHDSYPEDTYVARNRRISIRGYNARLIHNGSGFAGRENPAIELGANLKYYLDEAGYIFYAEEIEETYDTPKFALAIECDPIAQYSEGQPVRLLFNDGGVEDVIVGKIWTYDEAEEKFVCNKTSAAKGVWLNLTRYLSRSCMVAYVMEDDETYTILPLGDGNEVSEGGGIAPLVVPGFEFIFRGGAWNGVINGSTRIVEAWDGAPTVGSYVANLYTDSQTNFINVRSTPIAYKGYASVPSMDWSEGTVYGITDVEAAEAFRIFNGVERKTPGNARLVNDIFLINPSYLTGTLATAEYFYVPSKAEVTRGYYNDVLTDQFTVMVDGASKKIYIPVNPLDGGNITSATLKEGTLYHIDVVGAKGIISNATEITPLTCAGLAANGGVVPSYASYTTVAYPAGAVTASLSLDGAKIIDVKTNSLVNGSVIKIDSESLPDILYIVPSADGLSAKQIYVVHGVLGD